MLVGGGGGGEADGGGGGAGVLSRSVSSRSRRSRSSTVISFWSRPVVDDDSAVSWSPISATPWSSAPSRASRSALACSLAARRSLRASSSAWTSTLGAAVPCSGVAFLGFLLKSPINPRSSRSHCNVPDPRLQPAPPPSTGLRDSSVGPSQQKCNTNGRMSWGGGVTGRGRGRGRGCHRRVPGGSPCARGTCGASRLIRGCARW